MTWDGLFAILKTKVLAAGGGAVRQRDVVRRVAWRLIRGNDGLPSRRRGCLRALDPSGGRGWVTVNTTAAPPGCTYDKRGQVIGKM